MLIVALVLLLVLPGAAHAQIDVVFSGTQPVLRAKVGPLILSTRIGSRGINVGTRSGRASTAKAPTASRNRKAASASASSILATADNYVGTPYVWGGESPNGFDCSGFVQYVFREHGIELPRVSRQQAQVGQYVTPSLAALEPGDLLFFASNGSRIDHVGIYAGDDQVINASGSAGAVVYDALTTSTKRGRWLVTHHVATRRVIANGRSLVGALPAYLLQFMQFDPPDQAPRR